MRVLTPKRHVETHKK
ncbi:hypothetical protein [Kosakonia arachidis]